MAIRKSRTGLASALAALTLGAVPAAFGQDGPIQATPQSLPGVSPSGQSGRSGENPSGQAGAGETTSPAGQAAPPSGQPGGATGRGEAMSPNDKTPGAAAAPEGTPPPGVATSPGTTPTAPGAAAAAGAGAAAPGAAAAAAAGGPTPGLASGLGGGLGGGGGSYFGMLGDQPPLARAFQIPKPPPLPVPGVPPVPPRFPRPGGSAVAVAILPSVRGFKISENQSPQPQDRIYTSFNYYDNLNQKVNSRLNSPIDHLKAYRYILGVEKTVLDGRASVGLRLPIDSLTTTSRLPQFGGTSHAAGDLAGIFKYAFYQDRDAGRLFSGGLLVNMPTGPSSFAGTKGIRSPHNAALQPFIGYIVTFGDLYFHGFSAIDVPTNPNDVTVMYNDLGAGYYLYRAQDQDQFITAIAPTFEVHVNTPLNHRNPYNTGDLAGSYDFVDFTFGTNFQIRRRGLLALAIVEPVTGPRPFTLETVVQFNYRF